MLANFTIKRTFNKLRVSLYVDCDAKESALVVSYDRRLIRVGEIIPFHETNTPELAERWLSRTTSEYGSRVEWLETMCRTGRMRPEGVENETA